ncbi:RING/U-box superfamily protein [Zea mays]|uniref:RING/U-box superfamily protein n=1 Tax=Zea mays TaxID=4577 RepID=A0A1D6NG17_MAIZE|nr:RING/U-box superfamily protein [Zea mays]
MEVQVFDLSSDSEGEVTAHSPDHKRPSRQPGADPNRGGGETGSSALDSLFEQAGAAKPQRHPSDALKKGKEKAVEGESAGPPKHSGELLGAAGRVLGSGSGPWSALMSKCKAGDGGNNGAGCWGSWGDRGDQLTNSTPMPRLGSERKGFDETYELRGMPQLHSDSAASSDHWKGILGASPGDVSPLWCSRDTSMKDNEDETFSQRSVSARSCDYFLVEDTSPSWLSKVKGLNFPLPDEHQSRTRQIETDEMFARRLQEQLNQQQLGSQHSEATDTTIAWTLHEQDAEHARFAAREGQSSSVKPEGQINGTPIFLWTSFTRSKFFSLGIQSYSNSNAKKRRFAKKLQLSSSGATQCETRKFISWAPPLSRALTFSHCQMLISQLTRGCFREDMDLETRLAVLDSLSEAFKNCEDTLSPDSDDDDYEDLIALDDDNHHRGASDDQINSLPLSLIEGENCSDEPCNICLDCPSAGDSLRHLPCLHKFHKECIDRWLGMKIWCPICKLNVFSQ